MENEILVGRFSRLLQKLLSMKGPSPSPQLAGDIMPALILENDRTEWGFLSGEARFAATLTAAAVAGNQGGVGLFNGQATGSLVILETIIFLSAGLTFQIRMGVTTGLSGTVRPQALDMRWLGKNSTAQMGTLSELAPTGAHILDVATPAAGGTLILPFSAILPPNVTPTPVNGPPNVVVECTTVNTAFIIGMIWRERQLEASEGPVPGA